MPWHFGPAQIVAVGIILTFSGINCASVAFGGKVQSLLTVAKVLGISVIVIGVFFFTPGVAWESVSPESRTQGLTMVQAFGAAMLAALWAYDGWNNMPMAAGEVQNPSRNIPFALIVGMVIILLIYCATNLAYFHALPIDEIAKSTSAKPVATKAVETFLGPIGAKFVTIAIMISITGALNGSILTGARVPFAMARNGLFFSRIGNLSAGARVPVLSLVVQAVWASLLALLGTFDQLTNYVVFASWIFYGMTTTAVFVLRRKMPDAERPYKTFGYPLMPMVFVAVAIWLLVNTLQTNPVEAGAGLLLIALGAPIYLYYRRSGSRIDATGVEQ